MRILHTSDWHLGKLFHAFNLIEDQRHVLEQVVSMARDERPDAVIVAGDVYDRAVPPAEAVEVLDWVLTELVLGLRTPTIVIAGNHDSADRLRFGSRLLESNGLHVVGKLEGNLRPIAVGRGFVCPCPFVDPASAREWLQDDSIATHDDAVRTLAAQYRKRLPTGVPAVLAAHAFVAGGSVSDSERPVSIGGADQVRLDAFDGFAYTALGHLHSPQTTANPRVRYSGSLLKYSKSEAAKGKSVTLVDIDGAGACTLRELPLSPRRDVREVEGLLADFEAGTCPGAPDDYLYVKLLDQAMPLNAMARLRARFPNVVDLTVPAAQTVGAGSASGASLRQLDDITLFDTFMKEATGSGLGPEDRALLAAAIAAVDGEVQS
jgi:exonuclease SbcD